MNAPIVAEVRRVREAHAARFNYDLDAIFRDIKEQEKQSGLKFVSFGPHWDRATSTLLPPQGTGTACARTAFSRGNESSPVSLLDDGYLEISGDTICLTRSGLLHADGLLPAFFEPEHRGVRYT